MCVCIGTYSNEWTLMLCCFGGEPCEDDDALGVCGSTLGGPGWLCLQCVCIRSFVYAYICLVHLWVMNTWSAGNRSSTSLLFESRVGAAAASTLLIRSSRIYFPLSSGLTWLCLGNTALLPGETATEGKPPVSCTQYISGCTPCWHTLSLLWIFLLITFY